MIYAIVLTWNSRNEIAACLKHLIASTYPGRQIIVVDNASTDDTLAIVRADFPDVLVIQNTENLGFVRGNNLGIEYALAHDADYVFLVNDDTAVATDALEQLVRVGDENAGAGILSPAIASFFRPDRIYLGGVIDWRNCEAHEALASDSAADVVEIDYAPGAALLIKAAVAKQIGSLDADYFSYYEDVDWSVRCREAGYRVLGVRRATILHKGTTDDDANKNARSWFYARRNQLLFARKFKNKVEGHGFLQRYLKLCWWEISTSVDAGNLSKAEAVMDGMWAGYRGYYGSERRNAPLWLKQSVIGIWAGRKKFKRALATARARFPIRTWIRRKFLPASK